MLTENITRLRELHTFDKGVFVANEKYDQTFCNFILSLALVWNDLKNTMLFYEHIKFIESEKTQKEDEEKPSISPFWGETAGIKVHLEKLVAATIHELYKLIDKSKTVIKSKEFVQLMRQLDKPSREAWENLILFSKDIKKPKTAFNHSLLRIRNTIASHYDPREIFRGYKNKFLHDENEPFISIGNSMAESRFFFADAAAQEYTRFLIGENFLVEYYSHFNSTKGNINIAIYKLILTFVQKRSAWKKILSEQGHR